MNLVNLSTWAAHAGVADPGPVAPPLSSSPPKPSRARAREEQPQRATPTPTATATATAAPRRTRATPGPQQMSILGGLDPEPPAPTPTASSPAPGPRWTLSGWLDDGAGLVRLWLPAELCRPVRTAACVEPDDSSTRWTVIVLRPVGEGEDAVVWWSGGAYGRLELVEQGQLPAQDERRVRRGGRLFRVVEVPVPHSETREDAQRRADATLAKLARRHGGGR